MIRLLYVSQLKRSSTEADLNEILLTSRKYNKMANITGVLSHGGHTFMQILEGPEANVLRTYVRILGDKRHTDCRIIYISPAKERMFPNWTMAEIEHDPLCFEEIAHLRNNRLQSVNEDSFRKVMRQFTNLLMSQPAHISE